MSALTQPAMLLEETLNTVTLPLAASQKVWKNGMACIDTSTNTVKKGAASTTLIPIGTFGDNVDNSVGTGSVFCNVRLQHEVTVTWFANDTGSNAFTSANALGNTAYVLDDQTVTKASSGNSIAGRVWMFDSLKGVAVEFVYPTTGL